MLSHDCASRLGLDCVSSWPFKRTRRCPRRIKLRRIARFKRRRVKSLTKRIIMPGSTIVLSMLSAVLRTPAARTSASRRAAAGRLSLPPAFKGEDLMLETSKRPPVGTYRAIRKKHVVRYLAEFESRFNNRFDLAAMITDAPPPTSTDCDLRRSQNG